MINNPIKKELIKYKIIKKKNIRTFYHKTRDKKIKVLIDNKSSVIFLDKYCTDINYYKKKNFLIKSNKKHIDKKTIVLQNKKLISTPNLQDDLRRYKQFKKNSFNKIILDFGCGWGGFLKYNKNNSKKTYGLEVRPECLNFINQEYNFIKTFNNINDINIKFDLITMFHVLEHLPNQVENLIKIRNLIKSKGKIIIEVPHANDFLIHIPNLKEFKEFTFWSEHLILHTEKSVKTVLQKAGFKKIKIIFFQRYNLYNHLHWINNKKPGGHENIKNIISKKILRNYNDFLIKSRMTDTIIAIGEVN